MIKEGNATRGISNNRLTRLTPFFFQFRRPVTDCPKNTGCPDAENITKALSTSPRPEHPGFEHPDFDLRELNLELDLWRI